LSADLSTSADAQMRDDFLGEADEHLIGIRQGLLQLEPSVGKAQPDPKVVEALFLEIHSLKGISAIVGLAPAETVAHATEDLLRLMRDGRAQLTPKGLEALRRRAKTGTSDRSLSLRQFAAGLRIRARRLAGTV
jgi:chemotaxis protein histidine kinase CheA